MKAKVNIFWFRRDLRLHDNAGLHFALKRDLPVLPIFIFDKNILDKLEDKNDRRVAFIYDALQEMQVELLQLHSSMEIHYGFPSTVFQQLMLNYDIQQVFTNHDYEPYALEREGAMSLLFQQNNIQFQTFKDQVIFEKSEIVKNDGLPYTVFTPYANKWKAALTQADLDSYDTKSYFTGFYKQTPTAIPTLESMGFKPCKQVFPSLELKDEIIKHYDKNRNFPSLENGTSKMGVHLRFGTVSIRALAKRAIALNATYLNELIWRDFYHSILWHFPKVGKGESFKPAYERIEWRNNEAEFEHWCNGSTGYPIVDAGMRELNATGYMHNRVRMIVASFLTKHLLIDWRWGEAYFALKLLDFDLAANNGGWQWASSSGCDAAPYFRVFNPYLQTEKFDKELKYIRKWVPEFKEFTYPKPIVAHEAARKRVLEVYAKALKND